MVNLATLLQTAPGAGGRCYYRAAILDADTAQEASIKLLQTLQEESGLLDNLAAAGITCSHPELNLGRFCLASSCHLLFITSIS